MNRKAVFLDIDGTLVVNGGKEYIPQSAAEAIRRARENGHLCFLCTGRSKAEIYDYIMEVGVDGVIGAGGGYVELGNKMLFHKRISPEAIQRLTRYFDEVGFDYYLESNEGLFASKNMVPRFIQLMFEGMEPAERAAAIAQNHFLQTLKPYAAASWDNVNKVCFVAHPSISFEEVERRFGSDFSLIRCTIPMFGEESGELAVPGVSKSAAMKELLAHLGIDRADTLAFGDGMNDADMLAYAGVGIAMGNAKEALKAMADEVTETQERDGIWLSMKAHGLF